MSAASHEHAALVAANVTLQHQTLPLQPSKVHAGAFRAKMRKLRAFCRPVSHFATVLVDVENRVAAFDVATTHPSMRSNCLVALSVVVLHFRHCRHASYGVKCAQRQPGTTQSIVSWQHLGEKSCEALQLENTSIIARQRAVITHHWQRSASVVCTNSVAAFFKAGATCRIPNLV